MADNIVDSLFGLQPWQIQQQQNSAMDKQAYDISGMDSNRLANYFAGKAGGMMAGPVAGAMGYVNPAVAQAQMNEQNMAGLDLSDPKSLLLRASQIQDPRMKWKLIMAARKQEQEESKMKLESAKTTQEYTKANLDIAQAQKALRENPNLSVTEVGVKGKPGWMQRVLFDKTNPKSAYEEIGEPYQTPQGMKISMGGGSAAGSDSKQPLAYINDKGQAVWGTIAEARGRPSAAYDPITKQLVATGMAEGRETGAAAGAAKVALPEAKLTLEQVKKDVSELESHPGFESTVGWTFKPGFRFIEGSDEAGFMKLLEQVQGGAFLDAYQLLKGGGAITEIEGVKATQAKNRMSKATNEAEFKKAGKDFVSALETGIKKLEARSRIGVKAGGLGTQSTAGSIGGTPPPPPGFQVNK